MALEYRKPDRTKHGFVAFYTVLDQRLTAEEFRLHCYLLATRSHGRKILGRLEKDLGMSQNRVLDILERLYVLGYVRLTHRHPRTGKPSNELIVSHAPSVIRSTTGLSQVSTDTNGLRAFFNLKHGNRQ